VIDVRTPQEYAAAHIWPARNIDYSSDGFTNIIDQYDKTYTYVVYCQSGYRSNLARQKMESLGFKHVINLTGGFSAWVKAGLSVEK
jgi:phage shock protein E